MHQPIPGASIVLLIVGAESSRTFINVTSRVHSSAKRHIYKIAMIDDRRYWVNILRQYTVALTLGCSARLY
jgi:hypothetical protein